MSGYSFLGMRTLCKVGNEVSLLIQTEQKSDEDLTTIRPKNIYTRSTKTAACFYHMVEEEAMHIEDTERLVTEIEVLKVVLLLVCRNRGK
jgi:hypothetical protein